MSLLEWLRRIVAEPQVAPDTGDTETVRRIVRELDALEPSAARYVAAFAYVLGRVAYADRDISDEETGVMERLVAEIGGLPPQQAVLTVAIAKNQNVLFGATENYLVTRELSDLATREQRVQVLHCLFAVAAADENISGVEEAQIRKIATELGFDDRDYVSVRSAYNEKREVVKKMRRTKTP